MNRKLLFFDIDGTLLAGGLPGYIPKSAMKGLAQAQKNGHYLFINSGRTHFFIPQQIKDFPFDGYVCGCGTEIILHGETLYHHTLPDDVRFGLRDIFARTGVQGVCEGRDFCYFDDECKPFPPLVGLREIYSQSGCPSSLHNFKDPDMAFDKFIIFYDEHSDIALFKELTGPHFAFIEREQTGEYHFAELVPHGCSKASGIDFLVEHLGLSLDDCYVFGDSTNDLSMLTHVKISIAMGNSFPEVLGKTSYVTTPVDRDGIYVALKHFHLI